MYNILKHLGWYLIVFLCICPVIIWLSALPISDRFSSSYLILASISRISALLAIMTFSLSLITTLRANFLENIFGGLNKVTAAHHMLGGFTLLLALLHSTTLTLKVASVSIRDAANISIPFLNSWSITLGIISLWCLIALIVLTLYVKLPYDIWLITHKLLGPIFLLAAIHTIFVGSDVSSNGALKTYLIIFTALACITYVYRTVLPQILVKRYRYFVAEAHQLKRDVVRITLRPYKNILAYKSGQFIFVSFRARGFSPEWHPFSISSSSTPENITITVKALGDYTKALVNFAPSMVGSSVLLEGSFGRFSMENYSRKKQIWLAGGIGITPFLSMLGDIRPGYKIDLYYSVKTEDELIDKELLKDYVTACRGALRVFPVIASRDGLLNAERIAQTSGDIKHSDILICGPPPMMHSLGEQFYKLGLPHRQIHTEEFSFS